MNFTTTINDYSWRIPCDLKKTKKGTHENSINSGSLELLVLLFQDKRTLKGVILFILLSFALLKRNFLFLLQPQKEKETNPPERTVRYGREEKSPLFEILRILYPLCQHKWLTSPPTSRWSYKAFLISRKFSKCGSFVFFCFA